jgi:pectate lyase
MAALVLSSALIPLGSGLAREKWPQPTEDDRQQTKAFKQHEQEVLKRIAPELQEWAKKGKPYIPSAAKPDDLPQAKVPAFPGAEGGGQFSFGGRGGKIYVVTNLADSGPGTLREACEAAGPRIVVFNVSGIIHLKMPIFIEAPYLTIAGQTAPGDGVCVAGESTLVDTHDVVIRHLRFRRGNPNVSDRDDALGGNPIGNIVVDHCSASWGGDENLSMYRHMYDPGNGKPELKLPTLNITIQWCISSEALDPYNHAFGGTWGGLNSTFHHNLFACNTGRNPSIGMYGDFTFVNNVLFNWRHRTVDGGDQNSRYNIINNYLKPGPVTPKDDPVAHRLLKPESRRTKPPVDDFGRAYVAGNIVEGNARVTTNNWDGGVQVEPIGDPAKVLAGIRVMEPFPHAPLKIQSAEDACQSVLADVGATLPRRDQVDARIISEVRTGKVTYEEGKGIITDISQVGGYPEYKGQPVTDVGVDGIPLWWKKKYGLDPKDPSLASKDLQDDGYTVIDKYLDGLDPTRKVDWTDPKSNVNTLTADKFRPDKGSLLAADSGPKDDITSAAKKLAESANYSWKTTVVVPEGARFRPGPLEGKTEKDGFTHVKMGFGDNTTEFVLKGDKAAVTSPDGGWQSIAELESDDQGPRRFLAGMVRNFKVPAVQAADLVSSVKGLKQDGDAYADDLTEDGAKALLTFRPRGGGNPPITNALGSVKFWLKDGALTKYEFKVKGTVNFNGNNRDVDRDTTVEIKDVGATKLDVPDQAKKVL